MTEVDTIATRVAEIRKRMAAACLRVGREPAGAELLPISKTFGEAAIRSAVALGFHRFGESRAQEIRDKFDGLADCAIRWSMIGHLQTNKARDVARLASEIQTLDRPDLAEALERRLQQEGRSIDVLIQIKTSTEPSKFGLPPEQLEPFLRTLSRDFKTLRVTGLMTLAVNSNDPAEVRGCFRTLRQLRDRARDAAIDGVTMERLSMGMSGDFEMAIEEGATEVRIGTALFGGR
jgi:pyridoxal phosphate enzyme (YggS family)